MLIIDQSHCSDTSLDSQGKQGAGKKKTRGKKKNRKARRKKHAGKCSKESHRASDLSMLMTEDKDEVEEEAMYTVEEEIDHIKGDIEIPEEERIIHSQTQPRNWMISRLQM